jgi:uncharacterized protein YrrD
VTDADTATAATKLAGRAVRWRGIRLGAVVDVVLDLTLSRMLGVEVRNIDRRHRFLPATACERIEPAVEPATPLALLEADAVAFYRRRGIAFSALRGMPVRRGGAPVGTIEDVIVAADGGLAAVVVATGEGALHVEPRALQVDEDDYVARLDDRGAVAV